MCDQEEKKKWYTFKIHGIRKLYLISVSRNNLTLPKDIGTIAGRLKLEREKSYTSGKLDHEPLHIAIISAVADLSELAVIADSPLQHACRGFATTEAGPWMPVAVLEGQSPSLHSQQKPHSWILASFGENWPNAHKEVIVSD